MAKELAKELISAGVHFGHSANRWNPKMKPFIFGKHGQIHIKIGRASCRERVLRLV